MADYFFYGTLRDSDILSRVLGHAAAPSRLTPARLGGWRAVFVRGAWYPGVIEDAEAEAPGLLMHAVSDAEASSLAKYEDTDYSLSVLAVTVAGQFRPAQVFVPGPAMRLSAEEWVLADWQRRFKRRVLARWE